jgi:hypothetical protein
MNSSMEFEHVNDALLLVCVCACVPIHVVGVPVNLNTSVASRTAFPRCKFRPRSLRRISNGINSMQSQLPALAEEAEGQSVCATSSCWPTCL